VVDLDRDASLAPDAQRFVMPEELVTFERMWVMYTPPWAMAFAV
jgi:hypothetical protein